MAQVAEVFPYAGQGPTHILDNIMSAEDPRTSPNMVSALLTHCGLVTSYGDINLGQH